MFLKPLSFWIDSLTLSQMGRESICTTDFYRFCLFSFFLFPTSLTLYLSHVAVVSSQPLLSKAIAKFKKYFWDILLLSLGYCDIHLSKYFFRCLFETLCNGYWLFMLLFTVWVTWHPKASWPTGTESVSKVVKVWQWTVLKTVIVLVKTWTTFSVRAGRTVLNWEVYSVLC